MSDDSIDYIATVDAHRVGKETLLRNLATSAISHGLCLALLSPKDSKEDTNIRIRKARRTTLYAIDRLDQIPAFVGAARLVKSWHRTFVILVGSEDLIRALDNEEVVLSETVPDIQAQIEPRIRGYAFPIDDEVVFHGDHAFAEIVSTLDTA